MALPKLNTPTYELELPSTGEKIKYRPFLVKEQKILMMAQEGSDENEIAEAMGSLVSDCTFGKIDAKVSPMFDIEYIFLKVRGKSVGDKIELNVTCPDDEETSAPVTIDIEEIQVHMLEDHTNEVNISDDIKVVLRYPVLSDMKNVKYQEAMANLFQIALEYEPNKGYNPDDIDESVLPYFKEFARELKLGSEASERLMDEVRTRVIRQMAERTNQFIAAPQSIELPWWAALGISKNED